jgi:hypothetical protein
VTRCLCPEEPVDGAGPASAMPRSESATLRLCARMKRRPCNREVVADPDECLPGKVIVGGGGCEMRLRRRRSSRVRRHSDRESTRPRCASTLLDYAFTGHVGVATASLDKRQRVDGEYAIANARSGSRRRGSPVSRRRL